jgi:hypothetical protein
MSVGKVSIQPQFGGDLVRRGTTPCPPCWPGEIILRGRRPGFCWPVQSRPDLSHAYATGVPHRCGHPHGREAASSNAPSAAAEGAS